MELQNLPDFWEIPSNIAILKSIFQHKKVLFYSNGSIGTGKILTYFFRYFPGILTISTESYTRSSKLYSILYRSYTVPIPQVTAKL